MDVDCACQDPQMALKILKTIQTQATLPCVHHTERHAQASCITAAPSHALCLTLRIGVHQTALHGNSHPMPPRL